VTPPAPFVTMKTSSSSMHWYGNIRKVIVLWELRCFLIRMVRFFCYVFGYAYHAKSLLLVVCYVFGYVFGDARSVQLLFFRARACTFANVQSMAMYEVSPTNNNRPLFFLLQPSTGRYVRTKTRANYGHKFHICILSRW
jgi:hypothetical protein